MRKTCIFTILLCILSSSVFALEVAMSANVSCRADTNNPDSNHTDSSKLSIEVDNAQQESSKSWIKFDQLGTLSEPNSIRAAVLRLALHEAEAGENSFDVSAVNDSCLDNIGWGETDLTWNNAPANDTASFTNPDFTKATLMGTINLSDAQAGDQLFIDVSSAVMGDTDGIVQFILHNSTALIQVATHDHSGGEEYYPTLILTYPPLGADFPNPEVGETVTSDLSTLSWTNPEPNVPASIYCDVYLGTEPNRLSSNMDMYSIPTADAESVAINTDNFENHGDLDGDPATTYYWYVDCHVGDPGNTPIWGEEWSFVVNDNEAPYDVDAGADQVIWLTSTSTVNLAGTADDDGLPSDPGELTITWEETAGPGTSVIDTDDQLSTSVSFTERGDYEFTLTADDGDKETTDTVRIVVGDDACDASHILTGAPYNEGDVNEDCIVNLLDYVELIADDWLNCTDDLTNCGL